jgi:hypothetical protein
MFIEKGFDLFKAKYTSKKTIQTTQSHPTYDLSSASLAKAIDSTIESKTGDTYSLSFPV